MTGRIRFNAGTHFIGDWSAIIVLKAKVRILLSAGKLMRYLTASYFDFFLFPCIHNNP
jgi:hypothetical protein